MPVEQSNNSEERKLTLNFSNGAYQQLEDLQKDYALDDIAKVVELGVNVLELAKRKKIFLEDENGEKTIVKVHN